MKYRLLYFASLRDAAGCSSEELTSDAGDLRALYAELAARHGFTFAAGRLRVAVDGQFTNWDHALPDGAEIVFLPPVSGG